MRLLIEDSLIEDLSSLNQLDGLIKNQIVEITATATQARTGSTRNARMFPAVQQRLKVFKGRRIFAGRIEISDLNNKVEMLRELGPESSMMRRPSEVQQTAQEGKQQLEWNNLDKGDLPKLHPEVLGTAGQIVSLEANNIQEGDISMAKDLKGLSTRELTRSMMRRQQDTVAGMVEDLSEEVEELSAGWDSRQSYRPGWIVSTAITGVQTTTELVRITSSIKLRRLRGRDVIDGRSWSKAMKLEKRNQGFVDGVLEVIREKSEAINGAGKVSTLPMRGRPHLEDGGDGGAAEDRARLCELFDGLWKPGGQG
ncbi:hypothetical protein PPACK8108_LOCUS9720 [Phakopsora pachyrhizi]|uniref:Uncharacterized protein n=1 Tax=Phakopsora pachyrhizi TaxID=170000 RepID=A0AAV0AYW0_PHAPC|nr:hypothetical protein PPACK8108_LOCUS9720 [Phakopsora pachyrhizi]